MMDRSDVARVCEKALNHLIANPPIEAHATVLRMTSGTTGAPLLAVTEYDPEAPDEIAGEAGPRAMLSCIGSMSARLANVLLVSAGTASSRVLALDMSDLSADLDTLLVDMAPDTIHGFPAFIVRVSDHMHPETASRVSVVKTTGERLSSSLSDIFASHYPQAVQKQIYLASEVGGRIGIQSCAYLARNQFHPATGVRVGLVDEDGAGLGELVISKATFRDFRVEKYRIGDTARLLGPCACGQRIGFELFGRSGTDYVKVAGALLVREELERTLAAFPGIIDDYQAEAGVRGKKGFVRLAVYRVAGRGTDTLAHEMAGKIQRTLYMTPERTYEALVNAGEFAPFSVTFVDRPFARGHKNAKLTSIYE